MIIAPRGDLWQRLQQLRIYTNVKFADFPNIQVTKHGWLIGSYGELRSVVTTLKNSESARKRFRNELEKGQHEFESYPDDKGIVLLRYGRRENDKIYASDTSLVNDISGKKGSRGSPKIQNKIDRSQHQKAIASQGMGPHPDRKQPLLSDYEKNLARRVIDIDPTGDYRRHWGSRQFEVHHIVEDGFEAMKDAKKVNRALTRTSAACVLLSAELHQRFFTSALASNQYVVASKNISPREMVNDRKAKEAFTTIYKQLYADPSFSEVKKLADAIIAWLFS